MLLWGIFVISSVDNLLRPYLISQGTKLPFALIFCGVIGAFLPGGSGNPFAPALTRPVAKENVRGPALIVRDQESVSVGVGFEFTLTDNTRIGLGGRYFDETYKYEGYPFDQFPVRTFGGAIPNVPTPTAEVTSSKFDPQLTLDWKYADNALLFASAANGF
jgi:outer membrane receptor protein involved in Fe transport